ncbi:hypothetical protein GCM10023342_02110 [Modicisalibacter zincidurans]|uniref:Uncharacterized protein n=1 Tax=Modicisalibacter zincidurans TaxID=1178777 RepID=A0ABP9QZ50_9GAMM
MAHRPRILDTLFRRPRNGEIQASFDFDHSLAQLSNLISKERDSMHSMMPSPASG